MSSSTNSNWKTIDVIINKHFNIRIQEKNDEKRKQQTNYRFKVSNNTGN